MGGLPYQVNYLRTQTGEELSTFPYAVFSAAAIVLVIVGVWLFITNVIVATDAATKLISIRDWYPSQPAFIQFVLRLAIFLMVTAVAVSSGLAIWNVYLSVKFG